MCNVVFFHFYDCEYNLNSWLRRKRLVPVALLRSKDFYFGAVRLHLPDAPAGCPSSARAGSLRRRGGSV